MKERNVIKVILKSVWVSDSDNKAATASDLALGGIIVNNIGTISERLIYFYYVSKIEKNLVQSLLKCHTKYYVSNVNNW